MSVHVHKLYCHLCQFWCWSWEAFAAHMRHAHPCRCPKEDRRG